MSDDNPVTPRRGLPRGPEAVAPVAPAAPAAPAAPVRRQGLGAAATPAVAQPAVATPSAPEPPSGPVRWRPASTGQWVATVAVVVVVAVFVVAAVVLAARWLTSLETVADFVDQFPGEYALPDGAPVGIPAWIGWQHFFNAFLILLIIRSGLGVRREKRPTAFWSSRRNPTRKISLTQWLHQGLDLLWLVNGVVFVVVLFATGQWMRLVPTSWEVFPNAASALLQYATLDWPVENGWVNYNSLQQLAYFTTVFLAAPLAAITGVRMSSVWPKRAATLSRTYPIEVARALHFPTMIYFLVFIFTHVALVFATGALRNLNHMYASQDAVNWVGFGIFVVSLLVMVGGWLAVRPLIIAPIAKLFGTVSR